MSILDNEGHDPQGLGNTPRPDRAYRQGRLVMDSKQDLVDEIERLRAIAADHQAALHRANEIDDRNCKLEAKIERLRAQLLDQRCPSDVRGTIRECIARKTCGCTNGLILGDVEQSEGESK